MKDLRERNIGLDPKKIENHWYRLFFNVTYYNLTIKNLHKNMIMKNVSYMITKIMDVCLQHKLHRILPSIYK